MQLMSLPVIISFVQMRETSGNCVCMEMTRALPTREQIQILGLASCPYK